MTTPMNPSDGYPPAGGNPPTGGQPPPGGPPPGAGYPSAPPPGGRSKGPIIVAISAVVLVFLVVVAIVVVLSSRNDPATANELFLQPMDEAGADPWTPSVATKPASTGTTGVGSTQPTVPPASAGATRTYLGSQPGLYGGTRDIASCDAPKMLDYLDANPDKKAAWASVVGVQVADVRTYVQSLTSVVLRTDTYVTNHGFANGRATTIDAVLQAGTAVMVDSYGVPRVKCYCGNPLTPPARYASPVYRGDRWPGFSPTTVVVINQSTTIINDFTLIDVRTGEPFTRTPGANGTDGDVPGQTTPTTSAPGSTATTAPPSTTLPPLGPSTAPPTLPPSTPPTASTTVTVPPTTPPSTAARPSDAVVLSTFQGKLQACGVGPEVFAPTVDAYNGNNQFEVSTAVRQGNETLRAEWSLDMTTMTMTPQNQLAAEVCSG